MFCSLCNTEVVEVDGTLRPKEERLYYKKEGYEVPFYCKRCGAITFPYQPIRNVVFLYWKPLPAQVGSVYLPEDDNFRGGGPRNHFKENIAVVLAKGKGAYGRDPETQKRTWYGTDHFEVGEEIATFKAMRANQLMEGTDGKEHEVIAAQSVDVVGRWVAELVG